MYVLIPLMLSKILGVHRGNIQARSVYRNPQTVLKTAVFRCFPTMAYFGQKSAVKHVWLPYVPLSNVFFCRTVARTPSARQARDKDLYPTNMDFCTTSEKKVLFRRAAGAKNVLVFFAGLFQKPAHDKRATKKRRLCRHWTRIIL